jgi:hypothetical protein
MKVESMVWKHYMSCVKMFDNCEQGEVMGAIFEILTGLFLLISRPLGATGTTVASKVTLRSLKGVICCWRPEFHTQGVLLLHGNANAIELHTPPPPGRTLGIGNTHHTSLTWSILIVSSGKGPADKQSLFETYFLQLFTKLGVKHLFISSMRLTVSQIKLCCVQ